MTPRTFHALLGAGLFGTSLACSSADAPSRDESVSPPATVSFHACVYDWFATRLPDPLGFPGWTLGIQDDDAFTRQITGTDGCATIALPAHRDLVLLATLTGYVPMGLTVRTGSRALPSMVPLAGRSLVALPPWWWTGTVIPPYGSSDAGADHEDGMLCLGIFRAGMELGDTSGPLGIAGVSPTLSPTRPGRWLFLKDKISYDSLDVSALPYALGCFNDNLAPGSYVVTLGGLPDLRCSVDPDQGGFAWPTTGQMNAFNVDVRAGVASLFIAQCTTE